MREEIMVWWTDETDCRVIGKPHDQSDPEDAASEYLEEVYDTSRSHLPPYLLTQYRDRYGRAGRGRLWWPSVIPWQKGVDGIDPWPDTVVARQIDRHGHAGIVFWRADLPNVAVMPGFVTDMALRVVLPPWEWVKG